MKLRTRLNLVVISLTATFVVVLISAEIVNLRSSIHEEIAAANRVGSQILGHLAAIHSRNGGGYPALREFLEQLGRVRANDILLVTAGGDVLYRSPPPTWKAGREAPRWFSKLVAPETTRHTFPLPGGVLLIVDADASRAVLDAWDDFSRLLTLAMVMLLLANGLAVLLIGRALAPFPVIAAGLDRIQQGDLTFRLPELEGSEARAIGSAFNRMAEAVEDKVQAERKAQDAETRLEERRELGLLVEQRIEEERRLIAHELHDEFGQSVTAIRSLAVAISTRTGARDPETADTARLISDEAARLYDAMHGLIPRLTPLSVDTIGLAATLDNLVRDWQRRYPDVTLSLEQNLDAELGPSVTLAIYRVVQEGLINALRHAQPSRVEVEVIADANRIKVTVTDDGVGLPADWSRPGRLGLRGLTARVEHVGGALSIRNREPRGACLMAEIPLAGAA